ncbi:MAG: Hint domain-containing protein [Acetobacter malorum]|uniref:Hint domain-containing protein n=1 Tax=Acetobacter malorum TaxID=178901 RepID=UPI0039EC20CB
MTKVTNGVLWVDDYTSGQGTIPGNKYNGAVYSSVVIQSDGTWAGPHTIASGGSVTVYNHGILGSVENSGEIVLNGGTISSYSNVQGNLRYSWGSSGGTLELLNGAVDYREDPVAGSAVILVDSGATLSSATLQSGNTLQISGGGTVNVATVNTGATVTVAKGAVASGFSLNGGTVDAYAPVQFVAGGISSGTYILESGVNDGGYNKLGSDVTIQVKSGASLSSSTIGNSNKLIVSSGGSVTSNVLSSGGSLTVYGSAADTTVNGGSTETVLSGGVASRQTVQPNGKVVVGDGGTLIQTADNGVGNWSNSGSIVVSNGGLISRGAAVGGGVTTILSGGTAKDVIAGNAGSVGTVVFSSGAIAQGTTVARSGGTVSGGDLASGAALQVQSGGLASGTIADNGGVINVQSGGQTYYTTAGSGGVVNVASGGSTWNMLVDGGTLNLSGGGDGNKTAFVTNNTTFTSNGGIVNLASGYSENRTWTVPAAVTMNVTSGATLSNAVVSSGGDVTVANGGVISGTVTVQDGGSAVIGPNAGGVIALPGDTNGGLVISGLTSGGTVSTVISGFSGTAAGNSDSIELSGVKSADVSSVTYPSADQVALTLKNGGVVTLNIPGVESKGFSLSDGKDGWLDFEVCFLSGSMIQTPNGEVAVETLRLGDEVLAYVDGLPQSRRVVWAGKSHATVRPHLELTEAGYPVRILKDAISAGVPHKDMLITPEHCLFFNGRFVPARMLVNGSSIFYDTSITSYDYYHVETEQHSVLCADGMLTESYLDTGNRRTFRQESAVVSLGAGRRDWAADAAVPLCVERAFVEPLFHALAARADEVSGNQASVNTAALTQDPDLHLVTQTGAIVRPLSRKDGQYRFMLPPGVASVRIVSRASRPSDAVGPYVDDRRALGVAIADIQLMTAVMNSHITAHLQTEKPSGWYDVEAGSAGPVWTNGNALLPLPALARNAMSMLSLDVCAAGPYLLANQTETETAARSA